MNRRHHRSSQTNYPLDDDDDDDDDDVFSKLGRARAASSTVDPSESKSAAAAAASTETSSVAQQPKQSQSTKLPISITSSMKRHHGEMSSKRKRRMEDVLQELSTTASTSSNPQQHQQQRHYQQHGSRVPPHELRTTTNLFISNLCPTLSLPAVTKVFEHFGPLRSVKILWPRTPQEYARNRNTGFVCFRCRMDAERALAELDQTDPFRVGRTLELDWGKMVNGDGGGGEAHRQQSTSTDAIGIGDDNDDGDDSYRHQRQQPQPRHDGEDYVTGRQLEHRGRRRHERLSAEQRDQFRRLCVHELVAASRQAICAGMAFCFEVSAAALHVAELLEQLFVEPPASGDDIDHHHHRRSKTAQKENGILAQLPVETRIARLYLLSDILYNSQQPGIRNAFLYRNAIERMAPRVFAALGRSSVSEGRLTQNKLASAVRSVLGVWTHWGVFPTTFLDELEDHFEGRVIRKAAPAREASPPADNDEEAAVAATPMHPPPAPIVVTDKPRGTWSTDEKIASADGTARVDNINDGDVDHQPSMIVDRSKDKDDGESLDDEGIGDDDDLDGEPLADDDEIIDIDEDDTNARAESQKRLQHHIIDNSNDGVDGESLVDDDEVDGEALDSDDD